MLKALTEKLTQAGGDQLDLSSPGARNAGVGKRVAHNEDYGLMAIDVEISAAANSTAKSFTVPFKCVIKHAFARAKATSGSGTATVRRGTTTIAGPITMAADTVPTFTAVLVDAQLACEAGETLNVITNGANDRGVVTLLVVRA